MHSNKSACRKSGCLGLEQVIYKDHSSGIAIEGRKINRVAVGMLIRLQGSIWPQILMAVYQCALFSNNLSLMHKSAVRSIENYLASRSMYIYLLDEPSCLSKFWVVYNTDKVKGIKCYLDNDFSGGWN